MDVGKAAGRTLICFGCSVGVGLLVVGSRVFDPQVVSFQFVMSGAIVGALVGADHVEGRRWLPMVALGACFLILLANKVEDRQGRTSFAVYVTVLYLGTMGGLVSDQLWPALKFGKFVVWSALFGLFHLASVPFLGWALSQTPEPGTMLAAARLGAAIGAATGLGNELASGLYALVDGRKAPRGAPL